MMATAMMRMKIVIFIMASGDDFFTVSSSCFSDCTDLSLLSDEEDCCMDCLLEPAEVCNPYTFRVATPFPTPKEGEDGRWDRSCADLSAAAGPLKKYTSSDDPERSSDDGMDFSAGMGMP